MGSFFNACFLFSLEIIVNNLSNLSVFVSLTVFSCFFISVKSCFLYTFSSPEFLILVNVLYASVNAGSRDAPKNKLYILLYVGLLILLLLNKSLANKRMSPLAFCLVLSSSFLITFVVLSLLSSFLNR